MIKQVNCAHILVNSEKEAQDIRTQIEGGAKFADLAKKKSICPSGKKGGDLGWFGRNMMVAPFEKAAFDAKKGDLLGPIKTEFGWHLILVKDQK